MLYTADYFPPASGRYEVRPRLHALGKDFGNGVADAKVFQLDHTFAAYRAVKLANVARDRDRYVRTHEFNDPARREACGAIVERLCADWPTLFLRDGDTLRCAQTEDSIDLAHPDLFHRLALQVQEDLAVVRTDDGRDWLAAVHLCLPNFWSAPAKVGRPFTAVHEPVAGIGPINARAAGLVETMVRADSGLVRFAWGVTFDDRLDHHPDDEPSPDRAANEPIDPARAVLRVERQVILGLPRVDAALFTIRTYLTPLSVVRADPTRAGQLAAALRSMSEESRRYKGLAADRVETLAAFLLSNRT